MSEEKQNKEKSFDTIEIAILFILLIIGLPLVVFLVFVAAGFIYLPIYEVSGSEFLSSFVVVIVGYALIKLAIKLHQYIEEFDKE